MVRRNILGILFLACIVWPGFLHAQTPTTTDLTRLTQLYAQHLRFPEDTMIVRRINDERARIRSLLDDSLNDFLNAVPKPTTEGASELQRSVDRQKLIVNGIEQRLRDRKVDLQLLREEEASYSGGSGTFAEHYTSMKHEELLANIALAEEDIAASQFFLIPQQERLRKLEAEQRLEQFSYIFTLLTYVAIVLLAGLFERTVRHGVLSRIPDVSRRYMVSKVFATIIYGALAVVIVGKLAVDSPGALTSFAIVGAGIAVALQDIVKDMVGWLVIVQGRRFTIGHRIAIGPWTGDVVDISLLRTTLLEVTTSGALDIGRTGKALQIPNAMVLSQPLLNYNTTSDFLRVELPITVTYDSDWKKAEEILRGILDQETADFMELARRQQALRMRRFYTLDEIRGATVYVDLAPHGILFSLRFFVPIGDRRTIMTKMNKQILERFAEAQPPIIIAYPTTRVIPTPMHPDAHPV